MPSEVFRWIRIPYRLGRGGKCNVGSVRGERMARLNRRRLWRNDQQERFFKEK